MEYNSSFYISILLPWNKRYIYVEPLARKREMMMMMSYSMYRMTDFLMDGTTTLSLDILDFWLDGIPMWNLNWFDTAAFLVLKKKTQHSTLSLSFCC